MIAYIWDFQNGEFLLNESIIKKTTQMIAYCFSEFSDNKYAYQEKKIIANDFFKFTNVHVCLHTCNILIQHSWRKIWLGDFNYSCTFKFNAVKNFMNPSIQTIVSKLLSISELWFSPMNMNTMYCSSKYWWKTTDTECVTDTQKEVRI